MAKAKPQKTAIKKVKKAAPNHTPRVTTTPARERNMTKIGVLLFTFLLVLTVGTLMYQQSVDSGETSRTALKTSLIKLTDITEAEKKDTQFSYSLKYLLSKEVLKGYEDGTFKSGNPVNRAEFLKMLVASEKVSVEGFAQSCFKDVQKEAWYAPYICYAKNAGWVGGYPDNTFKPGSTISLAEIVKILEVAKQWNLKEGEEEKLPGKHAADAWYAPYAKLAITKGLWSKETFDPGKLLNRKEVSILLFKSIVVDETKVGSYDDKYIGDLFTSSGIVMSGEGGAASSPEPLPVAKKK